MVFSIIWVLIQMQLTIATSNKGYNHTPNSCIDLYMYGVRSDGYYKIAGADDDTWIVYCDFNSEMGSVWTLVMSWSYANKNIAAFRSRALTQDQPVNAQSPNWEVYRMSKEQMNFLKAKSTHWRSTCQFDKLDVDYRDYMRGKFVDFNITSFEGASTCKKVEYINVRGIWGHTTATFWQIANSYLLHTDSSITKCDFDARTGGMNSEDNFGYYHTTNSAFRCTSDSSSTTQYWFGSYIKFNEDISFLNG